jgi:SAM-dependent methyltransferase
VPSRSARARSFNAAAAQYAANRPSYPPALFDAIEDLAGRPLDGARVADVGAGTGIATALLRERGARVVAVEPGDGMAAQFHSIHPDLPVVRGDGNALPLATASVDLITYAQSWHWTDRTRAVPEAVRALRPGGALALWWNTSALDVPWIAEQQERIRIHFSLDATGVDGRARTSREADPTGRLDFRFRQLRWSRSVSVDTHLANLGSHSVFLVHDEKESRAFLEEERRRLLDLFPEGTVQETYDVQLLVATP